MARFSLYDPEPGFSVNRSEAGDVVLQIRTTDVTIDLDVGGNSGNAESLRDALAAVAASLTGILAEWEDVPAEWDGYVSPDRGGWYVQLSGKRVGSDQYGFPTLDIAIYRLAEAMAEAGEFGNAWAEGEHGPTTRSINDEVRAFHDEGGDQMKPLEGVRYAEGDLVEADTGWPMRVDRDYGPMGVMIYADGDSSVREYVKHEDRARLQKIPEDKS